MSDWVGSGRLLTMRRNCSRRSSGGAPLTASWAACSSCSLVDGEIPLATRLKQLLHLRIAKERVDERFHSRESSTQIFRYIVIYAPGLAPTQSCTGWILFDRLH
jgi:hypothetical protein